MLTMVNIIQLIVTAKLQNEEQKGVLDCLFYELSDSVKNFSSEHKRKKEMFKNKFNVEPVPVCYGTMTKTVTKNNSTM